MSAVTPDFQNLSSAVKPPERRYERREIASPMSNPANATDVQQSLVSLSLLSTTLIDQESIEDRQAVLNQYLQDTNLLSVLNSWVVLIAGLDELPYNPYPTLVWYARRHAERFHMYKEDDNTVFQTIDSVVYKTGVHVSRTEGEPPWWGLHPVLKAINPEHLNKYQLLVAKCAFNYPDYSSHNYSVHRPVPVLVGPCIFTGSFHVEAPLIQLRLEHGISGPKLDGAIKIFASMILHGIKSLEDDDTFILLEVFVPQYSDLGWVDTRWTLKSIVDNKEEFLSLVQLASKNHQYIVAQCLFMLTSNRDSYKRGEIQFNMNFIRVQLDRTTSDSSMPYHSAYEGVFHSHSSFVSYLAWFESVQRPDQTPEFRQSTASTTKKSGGLFSKSKKQTANTPSVSDSMFVPSRTDLGGFISSTTDTTVYPDDGPFAASMQDNIRKFLKYMISSLPREKNLFPMLHYVVLLLLLDKESEEAQTGLIEAVRLHQSTLYRVYLLMSMNDVLQGLIAWFSDVEGEDAYVVQTFFLQYRQHVKDLFCNELQERSKDFTAAGHILLERLDALTNNISSRPSKPNEFISLPLNSQVIEELKSINRYCTTIMLGLIDDVLTFCPTLRSYFPPVNTAGHSLQTLYNFKHGAEVSSILLQDSMYLNINQAKKTISAPTSIATQAAILKYFVDSRLDQTFQEFLGHVLSGSLLPPNPYPRLVTHLRTSAVRMELFGEKQEKLLAKLVPGSTQIVDTQTHVYSCPGADAYGIISAVTCLDVKHYSALLRKLSAVQNNVSIRVTDAGIKATIGFAMTGFTPLYGRMMPYVHEIELEEHYFLQGPKNAKMDVITYFTRLVYDHLVGIAEESSILFVGLFLGDFDVRRSLLDIVPADKKVACLSQLLTNVKNKKPIYMKAYIQIDWRLVLVKKSFLLHYIHGQFQGYQRFFKLRPLSYYQNVFSSQTAATLFARSCGPQDKSNPCQGDNLRTSLVHVNHFIESAKHDGNYLDVYRWLLLKSLMSQSNRHVIDAWYMLHGAAAQLEYLITFNKTLQNLVCEELSRTFTPVQQDTRHVESLLDRTVLGEMVQAYCQKLDKVLDRGVCMTPSGLLNMLHDNLRLITDLDTTSNTLLLRVIDQTPVILENINENLQPLIHACEHDINQVCPLTQQVLQSINA